MVRVTIEDCQQVDRFLLVLLAAQRVRDIEEGSLLMLPRNKEKTHVLALREIAKDLVGVEQLEENLKKYYQVFASGGTTPSARRSSPAAPPASDETFTAALESASEESDAKPAQKDDGSAED